MPVTALDTILVSQLPSTTAIATTVLLLLLLLFVRLVTVNQGEVVIIERFGIFHRILNPGIHVVVRFFEGEKEVTWRYDEERSSGGGGGMTKMVKTGSRIPHNKDVMFDPRAAKCMTKDRIMVNVNVVIIYRITDPFKCVYQTDDLYRVLQSDVETVSQQVVQSQTLDELLGRRDTIADSLREGLMKTLIPGVKVTKVDLQDLALPHSILKTTEAMITQEKQAQTEQRAEQARRELELFKRESELLIQAKQQAIQAQEIHAKAERDLSVARAQAEMTAINTNAERERLNVLFDSSQELVSKYLMQKLYTDSLASGSNRTVVMPYEAMKMHTVSVVNGDREREHEQGWASIQ